MSTEKPLFRNEFSNSMRSSSKTSPSRISSSIRENGSPPAIAAGCFSRFTDRERVGYSVTFIPFEKGKPTAGPEDFLTGLMLDPKKRELWGRPVGLLQLPDGSLLVTGDGGGKVWRITYPGD